MDGRRRSISIMTARGSKVPRLRPSTSATVRDTPTQIGKYPVRKRLGQGGMGEVFLGHHPDLDLPVAIKTLPIRFVQQDKNFLERFTQEARTAARISHPNIVRIYDAGQDGDLHFIVMEYIEGGTLEDLQEKRGGRIPQAELMDIMIDRDGTAKIADLGLAKQTNVASMSMTATGMTFGTPNYMAPEQVTDFKNADHRADICAHQALRFRSF